MSIYLLQVINGIGIGMLYFLLAVGLFLTGVGLRDLSQKRHAILRNYPIAGHLRFIFEAIRPEMRQYFFEGEKEAVPTATADDDFVGFRAEIDPEMGELRMFQQELDEVEAEDGEDHVVEGDRRILGEGRGRQHGAEQAVARRRPATPRHVHLQ